MEFGVVVTIVVIAFVMICFTAGMAKSSATREANEPRPNGYVEEE